MVIFSIITDHLFILLLLISPSSSYLEGFLKSKNIPSLSTLQDISYDVENLMDTEMQLYLDLMTLFYADDTILMTETESGLQQALDELLNYCKRWKLAVNQDKTKILCILIEKNSKNLNPKFFMME